MSAQISYMEKNNTKPRRLGRPPKNAFPKVPYYKKIKENRKKKTIKCDDEDEDEDEEVIKKYPRLTPASAPAPESNKIKQIKNLYELREIYDKILYDIDLFTIEHETVLPVKFIESSKNCVMREIDSAKKIIRDNIQLNIKVANKKTIRQKIERREYISMEMDKMNEELCDIQNINFCVKNKEKHINFIKEYDTLTFQIDVLEKNDTPTNMPSSDFIGFLETVENDETPEDVLHKNDDLYIKLEYFNKLTEKVIKSKEIADFIENMEHKKEEVVQQTCSFTDMEIYDLASEY